MIASRSTPPTPPRSGPAGFIWKMKCVAPAERSSPSAKTSASPRGRSKSPRRLGANYAVPDFSPDFLSDDTFCSLAHAGANGMFIYGDFLLYAENTRLTELNQPDAAKYIDILRDATDRAAAYGVNIYFCAVSPKLPADHALFKRLPKTRGAALANQNLHCLCSSNEDALNFHADVFKNLFTKAPKLGGLIPIIGGESYYHCFMPPRARNRPHQLQAMRGQAGRRCDRQFPQSDSHGRPERGSTELVEVGAGRHPGNGLALHAQSFWSNEPNQLKLIDRLPPNVALQSEIEKDQTLTRHIVEGEAKGQTYQKRIWDYSLDYVGPSDRIVSQAGRCAERDRKLVIKSETSYGIELLHFPYTPCINHSATEWQNLRSLRPHGILQRWGFIGMFDSPAERLGFLARSGSEFRSPIFRARNARSFGQRRAKVAKAWSHFSEAVQHIPCLTTGGYYIGPAFLGPCHPLPTWTGPTPDAFCGSLYYLQEVEATFSHAHEKSHDDLTLHSTKQLGSEHDVMIFESEFSVARDHAKAGYDILQSLDASALPLISATS